MVKVNNEKAFAETKPDLLGYAHHYLQRFMTISLDELKDLLSLLRDQANLIKELSL